MKKLLFILYGMILVIAINFTPKLFSQINKVKEADKEFVKKNYEKSKQLYLEALKDEKDSSNINKLEYKIGLCLVYLKENEEFTKFLSDFRKKNTNNVWEARSYYLEGLYQAHLYSYSQSAGSEAFDKARELYVKYFKSGLIAQNEINSLDAMLVDRLEQSVNRYYTMDYDKYDAESEYKYLMNKEKESLAEEKGEYSSVWEARKKIVYLYRGLASFYLKDNDKYYNVIYDFANFLRRVGRTEIYKKEYNKIFSEIIGNSKNTDLIAKTNYLLGVASETENDYIKAIEYYNTLIKKYPKSKWINDARQHIQELQKPQLSLNIKNQFFMTDTISADMASRNIKEVSLTILEIDFPEILKDKLNDKDFDINNFKKLFNDVKNIQKYSMKEIFHWDLKTSSKGDYKYCNDKIVIPDRIIDGKKGQYILVASANNVKAAAVVIVTDMIMLSRTENSRLHYWLTNSKTGEPSKDINIVTRFGQYDREPKIIEQKTDLEGRLIIDSPGGYSNVTAIAFNQKSFAATNDFYLRFYEKNYENLLKYTITDRPVYRPGQTVYFKHIVKTNTDGLFLPVKDKKVKLIIRDSRYQEIYKKELITNEFGSIYDKIVLPEDAPLGLYNFSLLVEEMENYESYTQGFRVEEYKRPEYKVNIESVSEKLKLGQNLKIKISADYYYGAPVSNAEVEYTVKRSNYRQYLYPVNPFDWLYKGRREFYYNYWWYYDKQEELVETKVSKLNEQGFLILSYETESLISKDWIFDYEYTIEANVKDASRRVIEGSGNIIVPRHEFNVFIKNERGYITPNENSKFTFSALTPDNQSKNISGEIRVFKLIPSKDEKKYDSILVKKDSIGISKNKNDYSMKFKESGKYKIEFETQDIDKEKVFSELYFYVADAKFSGKTYYFDKLELIADKESYAEGDTMRLLINSEVESPSIWLSIEAENKIFDNRVIKIDGKSTIFEYPVAKRDVPNIFINAFLIRNNQLYREDRQIMVPPDRQIIKVEITSNKNQYEPKEKVTLKIKTMNYKGEPVKSEVALSVFDASLLYIQDFLTLDIKKYFYGTLRYNSIQTISSLELNISTVSEDFNKYAQYKIIGFPDGFFRVSKFLRYYMDLEIADENEMRVGALSAPTMQKSAKAMRTSENFDMAMAKEAAPRGEGEDKKDGKADGGSGKAEVEVIRENFAESLLWNPVIVTDEKGSAEISFDMNDALTKWQVEAKAVSLASEVGQSSTDFTSKKDFMIRFQGPRFLQERDEVVISAIINNYTGKTINADAIIKYDKNLITLVGNETVKFISKTEKEERIDWLFKVNKTGSAEIIVKAEGENKSDAVKFILPVIEYGSEKTVVINNEMKDLSDQVTEIEIPSDIRNGSQSVNITLNPTLATVVLSALPYLIEYPYGCFEQTINRFVPISVVAKTMKDLNIDLYDIQEFNQKIDKKYLGYLTQIFNKKEINKTIYESLKRIYDFQNPDGGFSWWKGFQSDLYMTSLGISSLSTAIRMGVDIKQDVLDRAASFLVNELKLKESIDPNLQTMMLYSVSNWNPELVNKNMLDELYKLRDHLSYYSTSLLGLTYRNIFLKDRNQFDRNKEIPINLDSPILKENVNNDELEKLKIIVSNLLDRMKIEKSDNCAYWKQESTYYWLWYNNRIETTAMILKLLNSVDPGNENLSKIVRWLVNNRKGNTWYSTKDTGLLLEILMEYIKVHRELDIDYNLKVSLDEKVIKELKVNRENLFTFNNKINIDGLSSGKHNIRIEKNGSGNLNYSVLTKYFIKEDTISSAGNEIFIEREYFRLVKEIKTIDGIEKIEYKEVPIKNNDNLISGDEIRVKLHVDSKNDYEYLVFEDRKPSGAEFKLLKSWGGYMELRDEKAIFFKDYLSQGKTTIQYDMRAEVPGKFNVMPALGYAMYVPEIRANSQSIKIVISDKK
jgi:alpha-2-macroglobulin